MVQAGKIDNAIQEIKRIKIKIIGINEMRWPESRNIEKEGHRIFYSDLVEGKLEYGVGIITSKMWDEV